MLKSVPHFTKQGDCKKRTTLFYFSKVANNNPLFIPINSENKTTIYCCSKKNSMLRHIRACPNLPDWTGKGQRTGILIAISKKQTLKQGKTPLQA